MNPVHFGALGFLGILAALDGDTATADTMVDRLQGIDRPYSFGRTQFRRARIAVRLGQYEDAYHLIRESNAQGRSFPGLFHELEFKLLEAYAPFDRFMQPRG